MNIWLYLTAEGVAEPSAQWPCCLVSTPAKRSVLTLAEAAARLRGETVRLVLPMEMCAWLQTEKWPSRRRPDAQAIAFAIEDQLSEDLEALHLSVGPRDPHGRYPVMVVNKQRFAAVLTLVAELGITVSAVQVDADRLPADQVYGVWWLGRWLFGGALDARLAVPADGLAALNPHLPASICWLDDGHEVLHGRANAGYSINLMHGEFRQARRRFPWSTARVSIALLFMLGWGFMQARSSFFEAQAQQLYTRSEQQFRALYPQQTRIVDLSAQLKTLQKQTSAGVLDTQVARLLKLTEQVIGASSVEVQRIEYRVGEGWKLHLTAGSFAELERLRERGQSSGLPIGLGSASKVQDRVQALLTLESRP